MEYRYGMRLRGFSPGCQPKQGLVRREDGGKRYHDILVYSRRLSYEELCDYELDFIGCEIEKAREMTVKGRRWYYQEFTDALGDTEALNLYDGEGNFVMEFETWGDMMFFVESPIKMSETCQ